MNEDTQIVDNLIQRFDNRCFYHTDTINCIQPNCLYFVENLNWIHGKILYNDAIKSTPNIHVILPKKYIDYVEGDEFKNITFYPVNDVKYVFGDVHNYIQSGSKSYSEPNIHKHAFVHPTADLSSEGIHMYHTPYGYKRQLRHISNVRVGAKTTIGSHSVIHKGVFEPTIIGENVTIGSLVNIGHNCKIGDHTVITPGTVISGSCSIGKNCWFGVNSTVKHQIEICDNVVIGNGSNVIRNIIESGIYVGNPVKRIKPYTENWNF